MKGDSSILNSLVLSFLHFSSLEAQVELSGKVCPCSFADPVLQHHLRKASKIAHCGVEARVGIGGLVLIEQHIGVAFRAKLAR